MGAFAGRGPAEPTSLGGAPAGLTLPHSIDAEREVLASILVEPTTMDEVMSLLTGEDFYLERHTLIFDAMKRVHERAGTLDVVTLQQDLKDSGTWEKAGGAMTLGSLLDRAGTTSNVTHYCRIVRDKAMIRNMIDAARAIETEGFQDTADITEFLDSAERRVFSVLEQRASTNLRPMADVVRATIAQIEAAYDNDDSITGLGTGFRDLDKLTHGLQKGDLIIVAARPAMGKTSFCLNLAANAALKHGGSVAIFSLEMPSEQLCSRILAAQARIDLSRLRGGFLTDEDWAKLPEAANNLSQSKLFLDDTPGASPSTIRAKCRRLARREGLDLVIIDYLQLMSLAGSKSREQEISQISRSLKHLAKEIGIPVIALSQLNRGVESRTDKRPLMSDLRESGAIEQDADIIMFLYREEVYKKDIEEDQRGVSELIVSKHRNGATGTIKLKFWHSWTRFDNLAMPTEH